MFWLIALLVVQLTFEHFPLKSLNMFFSDWRLSIAGSKGRIRSLLQDPSEAVRFGACSALGSMQACGFPRRSSCHAEESRELDDAE